MNYSEMSDVDINKSVAIALGGEILNWPKEPKLGVSFDGYNAVDVDYCNNPSDAWPIIVESKISIFWNGNNWQAEHALHNAIRHENPLRAAMIVFLMMNEADSGI